MCCVKILVVYGTCIYQLSNGEYVNKSETSKPITLMFTTGQKKRVGIESFNRYTTRSKARKTTVTLSKARPETNRDTTRSKARKTTVTLSKARP